MVEPELRAEPMQLYRVGENGGVQAVWAQGMPTESYAYLKLVDAVQHNFSHNEAGLVSSAL